MLGFILDYVPERGIQNNEDVAYIRELLELTKHDIFMEAVIFAIMEGEYNDQITFWNGSIYRGNAISIVYSGAFC